MDLRHIFELDGGVTLVTGATRGIGRCVAEILTLHGGRVVVTSRSQRDCEAVCATLNAAAGGDVAFPLECDQADPEAVKGMVDAACARWGRLDAVVANAYEAHVGRPSEVLQEVYQRLFQVNVLNTMVMAERALPALRQSPNASMTLMGSVSGLKASQGTSAYAISKRALMQVLDNYTVDWAQYGIRVNAVLPGPTRTPALSSLWRDKALEAAYVSNHLLRKMGEPEEIAAAVLLFASPAGRSTTGQMLVIDNGRTFHVPPQLPAVYSINPSDDDPTADA